MPEIAEAQALLAALTETDEVKAEAAQRQRLTQLHVAYGNALIAARGCGAPETTEAFAKGRESALATRTRPGDWRPTSAYGPAATREASCRRCGRTLRPSSATSRRDPIRLRPASPIAPPGSPAGSPESIARRGITSKGALALFQPGRDDDLAFRFGLDPGVAAMVYLAIASWPLGEVDRAISLIDRAQLAARISPMSALAPLQECMRPCSN